MADGQPEKDRPRQGSEFAFDNLPALPVRDFTG